MSHLQLRRPGQLQQSMRGAPVFVLPPLHPLPGGLHALSDDLIIPGSIQERPDLSPMYWHRMVCMPVTVGDVHHMLTKIQDDHTSLFCVNELFTKLGGASQADLL